MKVATASTASGLGRLSTAFTRPGDLGHAGYRFRFSNLRLKQLLVTELQSERAPAAMGPKRGVSCFPRKHYPAQPSRHRNLARPYFRCLWFYS